MSVLYPRFTKCEASLLNLGGREPGARQILVRDLPNVLPRNSERQLTFRSLFFFFLVFARLQLCDSALSFESFHRWRACCACCCILFSVVEFILVQTGSSDHPL